MKVILFSACVRAEDILHESAECANHIRPSALHVINSTNRALRAILNPLETPAKKVSCDEAHLLLRQTESIIEVKRRILILLGFSPYNVQVYFSVLTETPPAPIT